MIYPSGRHVFVPAMKSDRDDRYLSNSYSDYLPANLGGLSLSSGVYKSKAKLQIQNGDLTLDAAGDSSAIWIFQAPAGIMTGGENGGNIILKGGAQSKNIFWKTDKKIILGRSTQFRGNIVPLTRSFTGRNKSLFGINGIVSFIYKNLSTIMKTKINTLKEMRISHSFHIQTIISILFCGLMLSGILVSVQAQQVSPTEYERPSWHFGVAGGANLNFFRGTTQELNSDLTVPTAFRHAGRLHVRF